MSGDTITNSNGGHDVPLVFLRERDLFGNRKPSSNEWLNMTKCTGQLVEKLIIRIFVDYNE